MTATRELPAQLVGVREDWLTEEFVDAVVRRDRLRDANGRLEALSAEAEAAQLAAAEAVANGEDGAVERLLRASTNLQAAYGARQVLQPPSMSMDVIRHPLSLAGSALMGTKDSMAIRPLDATKDMEHYRTWCRQQSRVVDPPVVTDLERLTSKSINDFAASIDRWNASYDSWFATARSTTISPDPLSLLNAASELVAQGAGFAESAVQLNDLIDVVNGQRREAGRGWAAPR